MKYLALPILIWFFYNGLLMHNYGRFRTEPKPQNYFRNLAHSFLEGRLDVDCPKKSGCYDLLKYEGKHYLYWPPAPAIVFYLPIVAAMGVETPDKLISGLIGAFNVYLFSLFLLLFSRRFSIPLGFGGITLLTLFWGMGTVHFYMSMMGSIWCLSQVCTQTFLLLAFIFALHRQTALNILHSGIFFGLACYSRNHLVFAGFLLLAIQYVLWENDSWKKKIRRWVFFATPFVLMSLLNLWYNYARFGNPFDNGMQYQHMSTFLLEDYKQYGFFNLHYFPKNFWVEILSPPMFTNTFPFFKLGWDKVGFSFFWASPLFLLLFPAFYFFLKKRFASKDRLIMLGALLSILGVITVILLNIAPGWRQFASRYSLDYQVMMIAFGLFLVKVWGGQRWFLILCLSLVLLSLYMNYFGTYMFLGL